MSGVTLAPANDWQLDRAVEVLRAGGIVGLPTETVYGLGADADNAAAVRKVFAAKGRPADHPVIVHLASGAPLDQWAVDIPPATRKLADAFWPGPLTIILKRSPRALDVVTGGVDTVGLRVPSHLVAQELLTRFGGAIAAPSANRFGRVSPTTAEHVRQEFGGAVDLILDGGDCQVGLESTILDLSSAAPAILRPGFVTAEQIEAVLGMPLSAAGEHSPRAAGRLASHYAPQAEVEIVSAESVGSRYHVLVGAAKKVAVVSPALPAGIPPAAWIAAPKDLEEYARQLYSIMRRLDAAEMDVALVVPPPDVGIGTAIADRLRKAAGPRG